MIFFDFIIRIHHSNFPIFIVGLLFLLIPEKASAQIWQEDFSTYADGTTTAVDNRLPAGVDWSINTTGATNIPPGYFSVQNNLFEAYDTQGEVIWTSEAIDISAFNRVFVTVDAITIFANSDDTLRVYYKLDGGAEQLFGTLIGAFAGFETFGIYSLQGSTIEIIVKVDTDDDPFFGIFNDLMDFDNVTVTQQTELYSIANADWNTVGTWSTSSGGASCGCVPTASDYVIVENTFTVNINAAVTCAGLNVANGGSVVWTASTNTLTIANPGDITIASGGSMSRNGFTGANIDLNNDFGAYQFTIDGILSISGIDITANSINVTFAGTSGLTLTGDLNLEQSNMTVTNNLSGVLSVGRLFFNDDNDIINNNGSITTSGKLEVNNSGDNNNIFNINSGATLNIGTDIDMSNGNFTINNSGTINQTGIFTVIDAGSNFNNNNGATWNYGGATFDTSVRLFCNNGTNTFNYNRAGNQNVITPQDNYINLTISVSGTKTLQGNLDINNDLTIDGSSVMDVSGSNFSINLAGDWIINSSSGDPFTEQAGRVTFDGAAAQQIMGTTAANLTLFNLTFINTSTGITLSIPVDVGGTATFTDGIITSDATNILNFTSGSGIAGGSAASFVDGPVSKVGTTPFTFPVGDGSIWARLGISAPATGGTTFTAQYFDAPYADLTDDGTFSHVSGAEYWTLTRAGSADAVTVTLYWEDDTRSEISDLTDLIVARYDLTQWVSEGQSANSGTITPSGTITSNAVSNFSPFTFGSQNGNNALPVTLVSFNARQIEDHVMLIWETANELNNDYFTLERSYNGTDFYPVTTINGKGTTDRFNRYSFVDFPVSSGVVYYRLSQTDFDGTTEIFKIVNVNYLSLQQDVIVYPNPVTNSTFQMVLPGKNEGDYVRIEIYSLSGEKVYSNTFSVQNRRVIAIDMDHRIEKGLYLVMIEMSGKVFTKKLLIE